MAGLVVLILLYAIVLFSEFFAPYALFERAKGLEQHPPMRVRFIDLDGTFHLRPFVYGMQGTLDLSTFVKTWTPVKEQRYPTSLFVRGPEYKLLGLLPIKMHHLHSQNAEAGFFDLSDDFTDVPGSG